MTPENPEDGNAMDGALAQLHQSLLIMLPSLAGSLGIPVEPAVLEKVVERLLEEEVLISTTIMPSVIDTTHERTHIVFQVIGQDGTATCRGPKRNPQNAEEALANACIVGMLSSPLVRGLLLLQGYTYQFAEPKPKSRIHLVPG